MTITGKLAGRTCSAIVIGASAGGIKALLFLLAALPKNFSVPIIIIVHMPEKRGANLAEVFQHHLLIKVMMAEDKDYIQRGRIYFASAGYHLLIERNRSFALSCEDPVHYSRPSIDILMSSAADAFGTSLMGILLTGANQDGAEGMLDIHRMGGVTVVQNPQDADAATMPQSALNLFTPDFVLSLPEIQQLIANVEMC